MLKTAKELGLLIGVGEKAIYAMAKRNEIPHFKIGSGPKPRLRFDVDQVLKALEHKPEPELPPRPTQKKHLL